MRAADPSTDNWNESQSILTIEGGDIRDADLGTAIDEALEAKFADTEWLSEKLVALSLDPKGSSTVREAMGRRNSFQKIDLSNYPTTEAKIDAIPRLSDQYQRARVVPIAMEHGAAGSLELAERALRENADSEHQTDQLLKAIRLRTGAIGDPIDVADWIAANRDRFVWNPEAQAYVLP